MTKALITGITGQDGSYLAELLLSKGYEVHGLIRRSSIANTRRIDHLVSDHYDSNARLVLHHGDLSNSEQLTQLVYNIEPHEVYNLGAQSHVRVSFETPEYTSDVTGLGTTRILQAISQSGIKTKFYQASSSEMFGNASAPQNENTPFQPQSPYAAAKVYAYWMAINYRNGWNLFTCNGLLFNHESPRRGGGFVTRKISSAIARILAGQQEKLYLGNLEAKRDWGYAPEYVEVMWLMLQQDTAEDYVVGTGVAHSVQEFVEEAFAYAGLDWRAHVEIDPRYFRPTEVHCQRADASKAREKLGWKPRLSFHEVISIMVDADMEANGLKPVGKGQRVLATKFSGWHQWASAVTSMHQKVRQQFE